MNKDNKKCPICQDPDYINYLDGMVCLNCGHDTVKSCECGHKNVEHSPSFGVCSKCDCDTFSEMQKTGILSIEERKPDVKREQ